MSIVARVFERTMKSAGIALAHSLSFRVDMGEHLKGQRIEVAHYDALHLLRGAKALRRMEEAFGPWQAMTVKQEEAVAFARRVLVDLET